MKNLDLYALFQAEEYAVQQALKNHRLIDSDPYHGRLERFPPLLRDVFILADDKLCDAIQKHINLGADLDATPSDFGLTALQKCFIDGKQAAMRLLLRAGAKTGWTADQIAIALGETPVTPKTGEFDPFLFACHVGNIDAATTYFLQFSTGHVNNPDALFNAVTARAPNIVAWLLEKGFDPNAVDDNGWGALEHAVDNDDVATSEVLLSAGADPFGGPEKDYTSPVENATSEQMRALFVRHGINPARFAYAINPESVKLTFSARNNFDPRRI